MERINIELHEQEKQKELNIHLVRHGLTEYNQGIVSLVEANDLTEEGIALVKQAAEDFVKTLSPGETVTIWSSPMGRTLHTAKIFAEILSDNGIIIRGLSKNPTDNILPYSVLGEVENFTWEHFVPLATGGEHEFEGEKFYINKANTNPKNLNAIEYFFRDKAHHISSDESIQWPASYQKLVHGFEKSSEVTERLIKTLRRVAKLQDKDQRLILVTHDAVLAYLGYLATDNKAFGVDRAAIVHLLRENGDLIVKDISCYDNIKNGSAVFRGFEEYRSKQN